MNVYWVCFFCLFSEARYLEWEASFSSYLLETAANSPSSLFSVVCFFTTYCSPPLLVWGLLGLYFSLLTFFIAFGGLGYSGVFELDYYVFNLNFVSVAWLLIGFCSDHLQGFHLWR